jgi:hypothetical protein
MSTTCNLTQTVGWRVAGHARAAASRRGFAMQDVLLAAAAPELTYSQEDHGPGRAIHRRGNIAVAVHRPTKTVITVLLNCADEWDDADCRAVGAS